VVLDQEEELFLAVEVVVEAGEADPVSRAMSRMLAWW
jgi:hypothetical protein